MTAERWRAVGEYVRRERLDRGLTQTRFAASIGLSVRQLRHIESGDRTNYDPATLTAIELALGWEPGSVRLVVGGARPRLAEDQWLRQVRALWPTLSTESKEAVLYIVTALAQPRA